MYRMIVNGQPVETDRDMPLLDFLRDGLRLTSVKNGCGEGACGACTLLVDGKKQRCCLLTTQKADGKQITTVEGLSPREKDVYAHCFAEAGAVQCGFCIPGMVISAKALLDTNLNPTRADVKKAIRGNICRCTGYAKIGNAILTAADYFRENKTSILQSIKEGKYYAQPILGVEIPKANGKTRLLGVPTVTERLLQQAVSQVLIPKYEQEFRE